MKISNITLYNNLDKIVRNINFSDSGINVVYGYNRKKSNNKETLNSIGKTLFLKYLDRIYGGENKNMKSVSLEGYYFKYELDNGDSYKYSMNYGKYFREDEEINQTTYKKENNINRNIFIRQILLKKRNHFLSSHSSNPVENDYKAFLYLLDISEDIKANFDQVINFQKENDKLNEGKKFLIDIVPHDYNKYIKDEKYIVDSKVEKKRRELDELEDKIKNQNLVGEKEKIVEKFDEKNKNLGLLYNEISLLKIKINNHKENLEDLKLNTVKSEDILSVYKLVNYEIPDLVKRKIEDVENFNLVLFKKRKQLLEEKIQEEELELEGLQKKCEILKNEVIELKSLISQTKIFEEAMSLYKQKILEIDAINEKHLKLESAFTMVEEIEDNEKSINKLYLKMEDHNKDEIEKVEIKLRKFVKSVIDKIYDDRNIVVFSLEIRKKQRLKSKPLKIDFTLEGDFGEGVEAVKNLLMDLIYFNFNDKLDFIIQDSICFSGIDPRQVSTLIGIFNEIAVEKNKQYILSINKYQLDDKNQEIMDLIEDNVRLELSEDSKLWKLKKY